MCIKQVTTVTCYICEGPQTVVNQFIQCSKSENSITAWGKRQVVSTNQKGEACQDCKNLCFASTTVNGNGRVVKEEFCNRAETYKGTAVPKTQQSQKHGASCEAKMDRQEKDNDYDIVGGHDIEEEEHVFV